MKRSYILSFLALISTVAVAETSNFDSYEVLFTNPLCQEYRYENEVLSLSGKPLFAKPKNVYCTAADGAASAARPESPQYRMIEWIRDPSTTEIFFASLSFSNQVIEKELCNAVEQRGLKLSYVLDSGTGTTVGTRLQNCKPANGGPAPVMYLRGNTNSVGYAHNKLFMINASSPKMKIIFGSGNVSSGTFLHHENWHFITLNSSSYFAQTHMCARDGMIEHYLTKKEYTDHMSACRANISAPKESDITAFFVPGDGNLAFKAMDEHLKAADDVLLAAHRFSYNKLIASLTTRLENKGPVKFVSDDDLYWVAHRLPPFGENSWDELGRVNKLIELGMQVKFMETNAQGKLLHHNKYAIFNYADTSKSAVFAGAGNFTGTAFSDNFENFYLIQIPSVVEKFNQQYNHVWNDLATAVEDLPAENALPKN